MALLASAAIWILFLALGARLVVVGIKAKSAAEPMLGVALMLSGPGAGLLRHGVENQDIVLTTVGVVLTSVGGCFTMGFALKVFRPTDKWAQAFVGAVVVGYGAGVYHQVAVLGIWGNSSGTPSMVLIVTRVVGLGWCAFESLRYRRMYMKRMALGLAQPAIANRFLLFFIWTAALAALPAAVGLATVVADPSAWRAWFLVPVRGVGVIVFVSMMLIFMPPKAYLRFLERRTNNPAPGSAA